MQELKSIATCDLIEELIRREGVQCINVDPYEGYFIDTSSIKQDEIEDTGPATILIITD